MSSADTPVPGREPPVADIPADATPAADTSVADAPVADATPAADTSVADAPVADATPAADTSVAGAPGRPRDWPAWLSVARPRWLPTGRTELWPLAVARMVIGVLWLYSLRWKLPPSFDGGSERSLREWLELEVMHPAFESYGRLIDSVVLPNFTVFAWGLFLAELGVGLSLLLGFRVRIGALVGLLLSLNLGIGLLEVPGEWPWSYAMLAMFHGLFLAADAGRVWGLDRRRFPVPHDLAPSSAMTSSAEGKTT